MKRIWRPQFGLLSLFLLTTAAALIVWYWYQRPFLVESLGVHSTTPQRLPIPPRAIRREVEYVRRVWGGKTIRHGERHVYDAYGSLLESGNYRNGLKHGVLRQYSGPHVVDERRFSSGVPDGRFFRRDPDGEFGIQGHYERGLPDGDWTWRTRVVNPVARSQVSFYRVRGGFRRGLIDGRWECHDSIGTFLLEVDFEQGRLVRVQSGVFEQRLADVLAEAAVEDAEWTGTLLAPISLDVDRMLLESVARMITDATGTRISIEEGPMTAQFDPLFRRTETVPISKPMITARFNAVPLVVALHSIVGPLGLELDCRDHAVWILKGPQ